MDSHCRIRGLQCAYIPFSGGLEYFTGKNNRIFGTCVFECFGDASNKDVMCVGRLAYSLSVLNRRSPWGT